MIPWYADGPVDPWDHVESAMALSIGGEIAAAELAYKWMAENQLDDGSWWAVYDSECEPSETHKETHRTAYIATGVWHHFLITQDESFLLEYWSTVVNAIQFALKGQNPPGEIDWAFDSENEADRDALVTACSSIYKSLECALHIASILDREKPEWLRARRKLGEAIRYKPHRFDRHWTDKDRYAMDWFYPILCGVYSGTRAQLEIAQRWDEFIVDGLGCLCVSDEEWVTVAESCELVMALVASGFERQARRIFDWLHRWMDDDGSYWTGYQFEEEIIWPKEKPTWTAAAVVLAADALDKKTEAHRLFAKTGNFHHAFNGHDGDENYSNPENS